MSARDESAGTRFIRWAPRPLLAIMMTAHRRSSSPPPSHNCWARGERWFAVRSRSPSFMGSLSGPPPLHHPGNYYDGAMVAAEAHLLSAKISVSGPRREERCPARFGCFTSLQAEVWLMRTARAFRTWSALPWTSRERQGIGSRIAICSESSALQPPSVSFSRSNFHVRVSGPGASPPGVGPSPCFRDQQRSSPRTSRNPRPRSSGKAARPRFRPASSTGSSASRPRASPPFP